MSCKYLRYDGFAPLACNKMIEYEEPADSFDYGESVTDESFYVPAAEAIRRVTNAASNAKLFFDSDGAVDLDKISVYARQKGRDMAELSQMIQKQSAKMSEQMSSDIKEGLEKLKNTKDVVKDSQVSTVENVASNTTNNSNQKNS